MLLRNILGLYLSLPYTHSTVSARARCVCVDCIKQNPNEKIIESEEVRECRRVARINISIALTQSQSHFVFPSCLSLSLLFHPPFNHSIWSLFRNFRCWGGGWLVLCWFRQWKWNYFYLIFICDSMVLCFICCHIAHFFALCFIFLFLKSVVHGTTKWKATFHTQRTKIIYN